MSTVILKYGGLNGETFYPDGNQGKESICSYDNEIYVFVSKNVGDPEQRIFYAAKAAGKIINPAMMAISVSSIAICPADLHRLVCLLK